MRNYLTEFIGTFFLVLTIGLTVTGDAAMAPVAIGSALMIMVYMGGHISGAHYNPAVTLAVFLRGKCPAADVLPYMLSQLLGAVAAAAITYVITGKSFPCTPGQHVSAFNAVLVEFLFTFALALVVLNVATAKKTAGNSYYGLAIGFTVLAAAFAGGPISGGAFNPAVGAGPIIMDAFIGGSSMGSIWIYLVGPFAGGIAASAVFKMQEAE